MSCALPTPKCQPVSLTYLPTPCPCRYLEQEKALFKNRGQMRVLELGAGLGLAGIVAALQVRGLLFVACVRAPDEINQSINQSIRVPRSIKLSFRQQPHKRTQGPREVVLTDLASIVPFLEKNARFVATPSTAAAVDGGKS